MSVWQRIRGGRGGLAITLAGVVFALALVVVYVIGMGKVKSWRFTAMGVCGDLLGLALILLGAIGLSRAAFLTERSEPTRLAASAGLAAAGGILAGGGWGAALGLGLLGAAAVIAGAIRRDAAD